MSAFTVKRATRGWIRTRAQPWGLAPGHNEAHRREQEEQSKREKERKVGKKRKEGVVFLIAALFLKPLNLRLFGVWLRWPVLHS